MNASIYAYSPEHQKSGKGVLDGYCGIIKMYDTGILDLDHENDFELLKVIAKYLFNKKKNMEKLLIVFQNPNLLQGRYLETEIRGNRFLCIFKYVDDNLKRLEGIWDFLIIEERVMAIWN